MHELGPESPLHGFGARDLAARDARLLLTISARDPALAAEVHATHDYLPANVLFGMRYVDAVIMDEQGRTLADLTLLSEVEAIPLT